MLIRVFKSNFPGLVIGLFIVLAILWADAVFFIDKQTLIHGDRAFIYNIIENALSNYPYLNIILGGLIVLTNALLISNIIAVFELLPRRTYIPALMYIVFMSSSHAFLSLTPVALSSFFILLMLKRIFSTYNDPDNLIEVFNIGLLCGLASLFYLSASLYMLFVWIALIIFQAFSARRWLISTMGFLTPSAFILTYLFVYDKLDLQFFYNYLELFAIPSFSSKELFIHEYALVGYFFLISIASFFTGALKLQEKIIRTRKMFTVFTWFFLTTFVYSVFSYNIEMSVLFLIIPLSLFIPDYFLSMKRKWVAEFWFALLVAIIILDKLNFFV